MIRTNIYRMSWLAVLTVGWIACSTDALVEEITPGTTPIVLSGAFTKTGTGGASSYRNLMLMAEVTLNGGTVQTYIPETPLEPVALSTTTTANITTPAGNELYYPLGETEVRFFAYSGKASNKGTWMDLTAGQGIGNDALLSNYGIQKTKTTPPPFPQEGTGTPGSSIYPAQELQFRHVMTQLTVVIEKTDAVTVMPAAITFTMKGAVKKGTYPIKGTKSIKATANLSSGGTPEDVKNCCEIKKGVNYLVPTGATLSDKGILTSLKIDDYTAAATDLASFDITKVGNSSSLELLPGAAYTLTFKVDRLRVTKITLQKGDWKPIEIKDGDVSYTKKELTLDLGAFSTNTAASDILTKVILYETKDSKTYQYIGNCVDGKACFVTLPATVDKVDLYTSQGLLVKGASPGSYTTGTTSTLTLPLSTGGMQLLTPGTNSEINPYLITTPVQFLNISKDLTAYYRQSVNIDMETLSLSSFPELSGSYDGNGYSVLHLKLKGCGLFTKNSGTLKNIRIVSGKIDAAGVTAVAPNPISVGGICGENSGTIVACTNQAWIANAPANSYVGGICGNLTGGGIYACLNTGPVSQGTTVGGIVGFSETVVANTIVSCVNVGMLNKKAAHIGGICGGVPPTEQGAAGTNQFVSTCYWLTGTAETTQGELNNEEAVPGVTGLTLVADLSPQKMQDQVTAEETQTTTALLNAAIPSSPVDWESAYHFIVHPVTAAGIPGTGCIWPIPVKKSSQP